MEKISSNTSFISIKSCFCMSVWPAVMCSHALFSLVHHTLTNYGRVYCFFLLEKEEGHRSITDLIEGCMQAKLSHGSLVRKWLFFLSQNKNWLRPFSACCACKTKTVLELQTLKSFNYIHLDCLAPRAESEVISVCTLQTENGIQQQKCHSGQKQYEMSLAALTYLSNWEVEHLWIEFMPRVCDMYEHVQSQCLPCEQQRNNTEIRSL